MIEIKPTKKLYCGFKKMDVYCNEESISDGSDVITLKLNSTDYLKLDITKDGWIRLWVDSSPNGVKKKIKNVGYKNSLSVDLELVEEKIK